VVRLGARGDDVGVAEVAGGSRPEWRWAARALRRGSGPPALMANRLEQRLVGLDQPRLADWPQLLAASARPECRRSSDALRRRRGVVASRTDRVELRVVGMGTSRCPVRQRAGGRPGDAGAERQRQDRGVRHRREGRTVERKPDCSGRTVVRLEIDGRARQRA
jgi:hypothetical protein